MDIKIVRYFVSKMIKENNAEEILSNVLRLALTDDTQKAKQLILNTLMEDKWQQ